jgi:hypothetical protein
MLRRSAILTALAVLLAPVTTWAAGSDLLGSLKKGTVELKAAGPLAFGPEGILFIGDPQAAVIHAIDTADRGPANSGAINVEGINDKVGSLLGTTAADIQIKDLAVNPASGNVYLSVARGKGPTAAAVLIRLARDGKLSEVGLKDIPSASATIPNAVEQKPKRDERQDSITHMAYVKGRVFVAGLSNEEFSSKLRSIPFPFDKADKGTSIEIFHGAHGKFETRSPVRVFAPYQIKGEDHLLAAYTCTPLVKIPVASLKPGEKILGATVAELGNRNRPLSMVVYHKGGKDYALLANSSRGLMKIALEGVDSVASINKPVKDKAGLTYETIKDMAGVQKLDALDKEHAVVLIGTGGKLNLQTIDLP